MCVFSNYLSNLGHQMSLQIKQWWEDSRSIKSTEAFDKLSKYKKMLIFKEK